MRQQQIESEKLKMSDVKVKLVSPDHKFFIEKPKDEKYDGMPLFLNNSFHFLFLSAYWLLGSLEITINSVRNLPSKASNCFFKLFRTLKPIDPNRDPSKKIGTKIILIFITTIHVVNIKFRSLPIFV